MNRDYDGIIILGHPRSGTTLLRRLLDGHSNIACPGETHILSACARFIHADQTGEGVDMGVLAGLSFAGFEDNEVMQRLRDFALYFPRNYAEQQGKKKWAEKTAFDSFFIPEIERLFGDHVFVLGVVRHGLDVAMSSIEFCDNVGRYPEVMHRYIQAYSDPLEAFSRSWLDVNSQLFDFAERHPDNCLICRYEDLIESPEEILGSLLEFVGEEYEQEMIQSGLSKFENQGFSDHRSFQHKSIDAKNTERFKTLQPIQISRIGELINPMLEKCGYDPLDVSQTFDESEARRRYSMSLMVHAARGTSS